MIPNVCIWCSSPAEYKVNVDVRDNQQFYSTTCARGHEYCLTEEAFHKIAKEVVFKGGKISLDQYETYKAKNRKLPSDKMLIIGKDFLIMHS